MLSPHPLYPPSSGGRVRTLSLLKNIGVDNDDVKVDLISFIKSSDLNDPNLTAELCGVHKLQSLLYIPRVERPNKISILLRTLTDIRSLYVQIHTSSTMREAVSEAISRNHYDVIHVVTYYMMGNLPVRLKIPILLEEMSIEYFGSRLHLSHEKDKLLKMCWFLDTIKQRIQEKNSWRKASVVTTVADYETAIVKKAVPNIQVITVPNGVDNGYYQDPNKEESTPLIFFIGNYRYFPNIDAALTLASQIFPVVMEQVGIGTRLILAGADPPQEVRVLSETPGIKVLGYVEDYRSLLAKAWVFAAPLRSGAGTRLKILEAMSMSKAIVTTSIGCRGLEVTHFQDVIIENQVDKYADWIIKLIKDASLRKSLGSHARELAVSRYTWRQSANSLVLGYQKSIFKVSQEGVMKRS